MWPFERWTVLAVPIHPYDLHCSGMAESWNSVWGPESINRFCTKRAASRFAAGELSRWRDYLAFDVVEYRPKRGGRK